MKGLLIENDCCIDQFAPKCSREKVVKLTFGSETGVCKVLGFGLGFADLKFWFLRGLAICKGFRRTNEKYLEVLLLLLLPLGARSHDCRCD